jgi:hypothetical protein
MKNLILNTASTLFSISISVTLLAGDLHNDDSASYNYKISCGGSTTSTSISAHTTQTSGAKKGCTLEGPWGKYTVQTDKTVEIKGGKIAEKK